MLAGQGGVVGDGSNSPTNYKEIAIIGMVIIFSVIALTLLNFSMLNETSQLLLKYLEPRLKVIESKLASEIQYWWCNVGVTKKPAISTGTLWAHAASKNGAVLTHHTDMKKIKNQLWKFFWRMKRFPLF